MLARSLTIAALTAALELSACPAEAIGPWGIIANGTQFNGIALQGLAVNSVRIDEPDEHDLCNCQSDGICPENGTELNGVALRGVNGIRIQEPDEDDADATGGLCQFAGICPQNGTELNGVALRGATLNGIRIQEPDEDDADAIGGLCQAEGICPKNGARLNGVVFEGTPLERSAPVQNAAPSTLSAAGAWPRTNAVDDCPRRRAQSPNLIH